MATCSVPTGEGTRHGGDDITTDVTWSAAGSPHIVTYSPTVRPTGTLHLEPCATVLFEAGVGMQIAGRLEALGTASRPITMAASDAARPFGYIEVRGGFADLAYVTLTNGGAPGPNSNAMLDVWGASTPQRTQNARLRHVTIVGSAQFGLTLERSGTLTDDSTGLTIRGAVGGPINVRGPALAHGIPEGTYTGNTVDEILVMATSEMAEDTTWHDRGVPYRIGDTQGNGMDFRVGLSTGSTLATWTLEPGVNIRVSPAGRVRFQANAAAINGSLIAQGTAASPIVFTSAVTPAVAGQWRGLVFEATNAASTTLDHVEIRYAGGPSQANSFHCQPGSPNGGYSANEDAALAVFGQPTGAFLRNSTLADSAGDGVNLAYQGDSVDFLAGNTFTAVRCRQTLPRSRSGACPSPVPDCP